MTFALKTASYSKRRSLAHGIIGKYKDPEVEGYIQTLMKRINELESEVLGLRDQLKDREFRDLEHMTASNEKTPRLAQWTGFTTERGTAHSRDDIAPKRAEDEVTSFINMHKHSRAPQPIDCDDEDNDQVEARYNAIAQRIEALSDEKFDLIAQKRRECFRNKMLASTPNFDACPREESEELLDAEHMLKEVLDSSSRFQGMMGLSAMPENFQSDASLSNLELVPHRFSNQFYEVSETERREVELIHQSERGTWGKSAKFEQLNKETPHDNSYESEYENFRLILRDNASQVPHQVLKPSKESKNLSPALQGSEVFTSNLGDKGSNHSTSTPTQKSLIFQHQTGQGVKAATRLSKAHLLQESADLSPQEGKGDTKNTIQGCSTQELSKNSSQNAQEAHNASSGSRDPRVSPPTQEESGSSVHRDGAKNTSISRDQTRLRRSTHSAVESPSPGHSKPSPVEETATFAKATHPNTEMNISFEGQDACQSPEPLASSRREGQKKLSPSEEEETPRMQPAPSQFKLPLAKLGRPDLQQSKIATSPLCSERSQSRLTPVRNSMSNFGQTAKAAKRTAQPKEMETLVCFSQRDSKEHSKSPGFGRLSSSRTHVLQERKSNVLAKSTAGLPSAQCPGKRTVTPTKVRRSDAPTTPLGDKDSLPARKTPGPANTSEPERPSGSDTARGDAKDLTNNKKKALVKKFSNISSQLRNLYTRKPLDSDCVFLDARSKSKSQKQPF